MRHWRIAAAALLVMMATPGHAQEGSGIVVDTTADTFAFDGKCSLREAIAASNNNRYGDSSAVYCMGSGLDDIRFRIGATPVINVTAALPIITDTVSIVGPSGRVVLNGPGSGFGIQIASTAPGTVLARLVLQDFSTALYVEASDVVVTGSFIGTDAPGTIAVPNMTGIQAFGAANLRIGGLLGVAPGGACTGECNLIAGNTTGIRLYNASNALVQGNLIGTNAAGTSAIANGTGISLISNSTATIGGTTAAAGNVISGNTTGIAFDISGSFFSSPGSSIVGNRIGTNAAGSGAVPNGRGVSVLLAGRNYPVAIGGATAGAGNVISGNTGAGVFLGTADAVTIFGNRIGTLADGVTPLGNGGAGVELNSSTHNNVIGGDDAGEANVIAWNAVGVRVGINDYYNTVIGNSIHDNLGKGIQLDDGQDGTVSTPMITGMKPITGTACPGCRVDVYSDEVNEGRVWEGATFADAGGNWQYPGDVEGPYVTATATTSTGSTSEFSGPALDDSDADGIADTYDNCMLAPNASQLDTDGDGYGNRCDGDLDDNGIVNFSDLAAFRLAFGTVNAEADFDGSGGIVNFTDLALMRVFFGKAPGPSGTAP